MRIVRTFGIAWGLSLGTNWVVAQSLSIGGGNIVFELSADTLRVTPLERVGVSVIGADRLPFRYVPIPGEPVFVSPASGVAPAVVTVGLNPNVVAYLRSGGYLFKLQFAAPGQSCPPCPGPWVILRLRAQPPPSITAVVNAASLQAFLSPGAIISIFGTNLGTPPVSAQFDFAALYPTRLGNTTVTFGGIAAPLLYVSTGQINAVVPYGVAGQGTVDVVVEHNLQRSAAFSVPILDTAPAIFTAAQSGRGQGAILNNGVTINSVDNPAPKGSVVVMFGTGAGRWNPRRDNPEYPDGSLFLGPVLPAVMPAAPLSLTIGGQAARIQYSGPVVYQVNSLMQVNAVVPEGIDSGPQPVVLTIGQNSNAEQRVTVAVQ